MSPVAFPELIKQLPLADIPNEKITAHLMQGVSSQCVFLELPKGLSVPAHSHGTQWGIVVDGLVRMTIGEEVRDCAKGDSYFIPAGTEHGGEMLADSLVLDVFFDPDRYQAK